MIRDDFGPLTSAFIDNLLPRYCRSHGNLAPISTSVNGLKIMIFGHYVRPIRLAVTILHYILILNYSIGIDRCMYIVYRIIIASVALMLCCHKTTRKVYLIWDRIMSSILSFTFGETSVVTIPPSIICLLR